MVRPQDLGAVGQLDRFVRLSAWVRGGKRQMAGRVPILRQDHVLEPRRKPIDQRHHLMAVRHREAAVGAEIVLDIDDQQNIAVADSRFSSSSAHLFTLCQAAVDLACEPHQRVRHLHRIRRAAAPAVATAPAIARGRARRAPGFRPGVGDGVEPSARLHDQLDQRLAGLRVALERQYVADHAAVRPVPAPDLLAAGPGRLAGGALAPRQPGIFLELVGAVERRHIRRRRQAGADAEAIDRARPPRTIFGKPVLIKAAAGKDAHIREPAVVQDAPHALG